ncbi:MAG: AAA family ATPase, partial [Planctomycetes bacterium]|nr:AAA family ATPase [Planctomycetota bacterium]
MRGVLASSPPGGNEPRARGHDFLDARPPPRLLSGRARVDPDLHLHLSERDGPGVAEKLRQAYWWIVNNAIICPYYDMEFGTRHRLKQQKATLDLHQDTCYSSYVLLPLLTLATGRRLLLIGAPGRGKTSVAVLMGLLAGYSPAEVRRSVQHGHPQLTVADLLGGPLPGDLVRAEEPGEIKVAWRNWLTMRVKIIDEYNRIPTKTQSALLSLMAEGYAEMYEQVIETGRSAWFLTANDDMGGGTFQVIEALKDRIDIVVRCTNFNSRFFDRLVERIETHRSPEDFVPKDIVFSEAELVRAREEIRAIAIPTEVRDLLGFFLGPLDFCRRASEKLEYMNKDTLHLSGKKVGDVCNEECPLDKQSNLCTQTESGVSVRAFLTSILYAKALA